MIKLFINFCFHTYSGHFETRRETLGHTDKILHLGGSGVPYGWSSSKDKNWWQDQSLVTNGKRGQWSIAISLSAGCFVTSFHCMYCRPLLMGSRSIKGLLHLYASMLGEQQTCTVLLMSFFSLQPTLQVTYWFCIFCR